MPPPNHDEFDIREEITHNDMVQDKGKEILRIYFHLINYIILYNWVLQFTAVLQRPTNYGEHTY